MLNFKNFMKKSHSAANHSEVKAMTSVIISISKSEFLVNVVLKSHCQTSDLNVHAFIVARLWLNNQKWSTVQSGIQKLTKAIYQILEQSQRVVTENTNRSQYVTHLREGGIIMPLVSIKCNTIGSVMSYACYNSD